MWRCPKCGDTMSISVANNHLQTVHSAAAEFVREWQKKQIGQEIKPLEGAAPSEGHIEFALSSRECPNCETPLILVVDMMRRRQIGYLCLKKSCDWPITVWEIKPDLTLVPHGPSSSPPSQSSP